jgi:hypothetical protein
MKGVAVHKWAYMINLQTVYLKILVNSDSHLELVVFLTWYVPTKVASSCSKEFLYFADMFKTLFLLSATIEFDRWCICYYSVPEATLKQS